MLRTPHTYASCAQGLPLQCSVFLTSHKGALLAANASRAAYLFQADKLHADLDLGDKTIQCGRRADAFKLWLAWKVCTAACPQSEITILPTRIV